MEETVVVSLPLQAFRWSLMRRPTEPGRLRSWRQVKDGAKHGQVISWALENCVTGIPRKKNKWMKNKVRGSIQQLRLWGLGTKKMGACVCVQLGFFGWGVCAVQGRVKNLQTLSKLPGATKALYHTILEHSRASNKKRKKKSEIKMAPHTLIRIERLWNSSLST